MEELAGFEKPPAPFVVAPLPFSTRINYGIRLWALKIFVSIAIKLASLVMLRPPSKRPSYTKTYPDRPMITNRIFIPSSYKAEDKPLPLYISIHGGGFALCDPRVDDDCCSYLAQRHGICVVSIGYRRAPRFPFPTPVVDCAALVQAVLKDEDLPCDKSKVAIGGYSAGGNLSLTASQQEGLKGNISGVVAFYPVTDFSRLGEQKMRDRPATPGKTDMLINSGKWFNWGYIPQGTDRKHPLLSPIFAKKADLPPNVCMFGCEFDLLCKEAEDMADNLADKENGEKKALIKGNGWERGNVRWEKMLGCEHAFDHVPLRGNKEKEAARVQAMHDMHDAAAEWLFRKVYA
ncbi:hypothetical protein MMC30_000609 [Trapelia coarctata]|nr:hypothetical protein [Trapelia coarctata]